MSIKITLTLDDEDSNDIGCGWRNGTMSIGTEVFDVGGGWVHNAQSAREDNAQYGLQPEDHPDMPWPGATFPGDFEAYGLNDTGDISGAAEALGLCEQEALELVQALSYRAARSAESTVEIEWVEGGERA